MPEQWLPRAKEDLWPAEEERLEESLEDLGAAADDFLEPEEYAKPDGVMPEEAADLGRPAWGSEVAEGARAAGGRLCGSIAAAFHGWAF